MTKPYFYIFYIQPRKMVCKFLGKSYTYKHCTYRVLITSFKLNDFLCTLYLMLNNYAINVNT